MGKADTEFSSAFEKTFVPILERDGFRTSGEWEFARERREFVHVLSLQVRKDNRACAVNLAADVLFRFSREKLASIAEGDCEIRVRLTPDGAGGGDHWWDITSERDMKRSLLEIIRSYETYAKDFFMRYEDLQTAFGGLTSCDIEKGTPRYLAVLPSTTLVRGALFLAEVFEHVGDREKARDCGMVGLRNAGIAVGPKKALRELLQRLSANEPNA